MEEIFVNNKTENLTNILCFGVSISKEINARIVKTTILPLSSNVDGRLEETLGD